MEALSKPTITRRVLIIETVTFLLGLLFVVEPIAGFYYYILWFCVSIPANVACIIWLVIKKPKNYLLYSAWFLLLPIAYVIILYFVVRAMIT